MKHQYLFPVGEARPLTFFTKIPRRSFEERKFFISTYNMGESATPTLDDLLRWVPLDMDLYVIGRLCAYRVSSPFTKPCLCLVGVQECMRVAELGERLLEVVGGSDKYVLFSRHIGSAHTSLGYHGHIGIMVLARAQVFTNGGSTIAPSCVSS